MQVLDCRLESNALVRPHDVMFEPPGRSAESQPYDQDERPAPYWQPRGPRAQYLDENSAQSSGVRVCAPAASPCHVDAIGFLSHLLISCMIILLLVPLSADQGYGAPPGRGEGHGLPPRSAAAADRTWDEEEAPLSERTVDSTQAVDHGRYDAFAYEAQHREIEMQPVYSNRREVGLPADIDESRWNQHFEDDSPPLQPVLGQVPSQEPFEGMQALAQLPQGSKETPPQALERTKSEAPRPQSLQIQTQESDKRSNDLFFAWLSMLLLAAGSDWLLSALVQS